MAKLNRESAKILFGIHATNVAEQAGLMMSAQANTGVESVQDRYLNYIRECCFENMRCAEED